MSASLHFNQQFFDADTYNHIPLKLKSLAYFTTFKASRYNNIMS